MLVLVAHSNLFKGSLFKTVAYLPACLSSETSNLNDNLGTQNSRFFPRSGSLLGFLVSDKLISPLN